MHRELLDKINEHVSGDHAVALAKAYRPYPVKLGFTPYNQGIRWLCDRYAEYGLAAEALETPADGKTTYGDHHYPLAWDVDQAWIKAIGPDGTETTLSDYAEDPYGVVPFCGDSNGTQEGVVIPVGAVRAGGMPADAGNVVVLFDKYTYYDSVKWALELGCTACITHPGASPDKPIAYKAVRWFNDLFGEGQIDARHKTLPAFSVSSEQADALVRRYTRSGPVPVSYRVCARAYAGSTLSASARIVGVEEPEAEIFATAHAYEPHACNNVAGVVICLEAARALTDCIRAGTLTPPRRSVRFFHGLEMYGIYEHALRNRDAMRSALGGLTIDSLGAGDVLGLKEKLDLYRGYDFNPSFINGLVSAVLTACTPQLGCPHEIMDGYSGNDNVVQDPLLGPAWAMLNGKIMFDGGFYHSNADTPELLSPERLAGYAAFVATTLYFVADAGEEEARHLTLLARNEALSRLMRCASLATQTLAQPADRLRARAVKFQAFADVAVPAGAAAMESPARLLPEAERESFREAVAPGVKAFQTVARQTTGLVLSTLAAAAGEDPKKGRRLAKVRLDDLEERAARMIPTRKLPGALGLGLMTMDERREAARIAGSTCTEHEEFWHYFAPNLFWFDGKRSVLDAALATWSTGRWDACQAPSARHETVQRFVDVVEFLERHGYLEVERRPVPPPITKADIEAGLRKVGVGEGDIVMVHTKMSAFGHVDGAADTIIDALLDTVGPKGIVAMPTFTNTAVGEADPPYDPETSPVYTGTVAETFRQRENVQRSLQVTHSVAAAGERVAEFLELGGNPYDTFGREGPWGNLYDWGGKILFLGTEGAGNTYLHVLEGWLLNYLDVTFARVRQGDGEKEVRVTNYPAGCRGGWYDLLQEADYFKHIHARGADRQTTVGPGNVLVLDVRLLTHAMHELFKTDPATLLHKTGCLPCAYLRARLVGWTVPDTFPAQSGSPRSGGKSANSTVVLAGLSS